MNPNKKTLNPQNNSPWLLCPSKSFPGKFYYFNGLTGETAWSIYEADNKNLKKSTIHKVTDKTHSYPEPFGPPGDESTNTTTSSLFLKKSDLVNSTDFFNKSNTTRSCFGSSLLCNKSNFCNGGNCSNGNSFSSGNSNEPNLSFGRNSHHGMNFRTNLCHQRNSCGNLNYRTNMNPGKDSTHLNYNNIETQFHSNPSVSPTFGQAVFSRYVAKDLTTKVVWALTPVLVSDKLIPTQIGQAQNDNQHKFQSVPIVQFENFNVDVDAQENPFYSKKFSTSTPIIKHSEAETQTFDPTEAEIYTSKSSNKDTQTFDQILTKDDACQTFVSTRRIRTRSETEVTPNFTLKLSKSVENLTITDIEDETLNARGKVEDTKLTVLDKNDLRFKLVARRKMSADVDALESNKDTAKLPNKPLFENVAPKKRVTFNLENQNTISKDVQENEIQSPGSGDSDFLEPSQPKQGSMWYIAVDTPVLLTELECIEQFVQSDENCRLLIPFTVKTEIESLSRGDCKGLQNIFTARQIVRKLATPAPHIVVQRKLDNNADELGVLECCWRQLQECSHVILITNNKNLSSKADTIGLECHTVNEIKEIINPTPFPQTDLTKVNITVNNSENRSENLFQQSINELNSLNLPQREFPVHIVRRSLFDNHNSENTNVFSNQNNNDKLINLPDTFKALKNVTCADVDEIDLDIQRLGISDNTLEADNTVIINDIQNRLKVEANRIKNHRNDKETIKVSGITKLNSVLDIDDELKRYEVKGGEMENRIKSRRDEWVCRLTQTMEGVLTEVLLKENVRPKKILPPWSLHEAIQVLGDKFKTLPKIKIITTRFTTHLFNCSSNVGKLNKDILPKDFMKLVGFSIILIHNLKEILEYKELNEADDLLSELINHIEDPNSDVELTLDRVITPIFSRSDVQFETKMPVGYKKKQSDILEYLKKHFPSMEAYEIENPEPKVVRTVGKDLNKLKFNNTKTITVENVNNLPVEEVKNNVITKVIRNVKVIDAFEEKLMKQTLLDLDELDYEVTLSTISSENKEINHKSDIEDDIKEMDIETKNYTIKDKVSNFEDCIVESLGSEFNQCIYAYPLMKAFLGRLKRTFIIIYNLINESMENYRRAIYDKESDIDIKLNMAHKYILKLIDRLNSIIARECSEGTTLRDLLIQSGDYVEEDQTMAGYKQVVIKYLEQAQVLEEALTLMFTLLNEKSNLDPTSNVIAYHGTITTVAEQSPPSNSKMAMQLANQVL